MLGAYTKPKWLYFMVYTFFIPKVLNTRCLNPGEVVTKEKKISGCSVCSVCLRWTRKHDADWRDVENGCYINGGYQLFFNISVLMQVNITM